MIQRQAYSKAVVRPASAAKKMGMSISALWLRVATDPGFPRPFKVGPRTTVFYEHELDAFLEACAASRVAVDEASS